MTGLTAQQSKLLSFIEASARQGGIPPSYADMAAHMGLASVSGISRLLDGLEERGRLKRIKRRARSIEVIAKACPHCGAAL